MTELVTLDLATQVGWARLRGEEISYGSYLLPRTGDDIGRFLAPFHDWLKMFAADADYVFFEAPYVSGGGGGGKKTSQDTARKLFGLAAMTEYVCHVLEVRCFEENIMEITKMFCGRCPRRSPEKKALTILTCKQMGWDPKNNDEADALALLYVTIRKLKLPLQLPVGGIFGSATA